MACAARVFLGDLHAWRPLGQMERGNLNDCSSVSNSGVAGVSLFQQNSGIKRRISEAAVRKSQPLVEQALISA